MACEMLHEVGRQMEKGCAVIFLPAERRREVFTPPMLQHVLRSAAGARRGRRQRTVPTIGGSTLINLNQP